MTYYAIGLMSGSSLDGLDIVLTKIEESGGKWNYSILKADCIQYEESLQNQLKNAIHLNGFEYQLLHARYGKYLGEQTMQFIRKNDYANTVDLIVSHGHTTFHSPSAGMTHQIGDGAAIAAETGKPVITDLRSLDVALRGQGAPIVPMGEKLLFPEYQFFLNLGGIANISTHRKEIFAFDVCPANRILNMLANETGLDYDESGKLASTGKINIELLENLNSLPFYKESFPKSLSNNFGTDVVYPIIKNSGISTQDCLCTYVEHIAIQIKNALKQFTSQDTCQLMVTGGGAFNTFLIERLSGQLGNYNFKIKIPSPEIVMYKEALIMALLGVLRFRGQNTTVASVTGAIRNSIGGALWSGGISEF